MHGILIWKKIKAELNGKLKLCKTLSFTAVMIGIFRD